MPTNTVPTALHPRTASPVLVSVAILLASVTLITLTNRYGIGHPDMQAIGFHYGP